MSRNKIINEKYCIICKFWLEEDEGIHCSDCKCKSNFVIVDEPLLSEMIDKFENGE